MESMTLQSKDINILETRIAILGDQKARSENSHEIAKKQIERLEKEENEFFASSILGQIKMIIWGSII